MPELTIHSPYVGSGVDFISQSGTLDLASSVLSGGGWDEECRLNNEEDYLSVFIGVKSTHAVVSSMAIFALMACKVFGKRQLTKVLAIAGGLQRDVVYLC